MTKSIFRSKTFYVNLIIALLGAVPAFEPAQKWVAEHPSAFMTLTAMVGIGLRWISKGAVELFPEDAPERIRRRPGELPAIAALALCFAASSCQASPETSALRYMKPVPVVHPGKPATPENTRGIALVPKDGQTIQRYPKTAESDLIRALETMTPIK